MAKQITLKLIYKCKECLKEFLGWKCHDRKFCSKKCADSFHTERIFIKCKNPKCVKMVLRYPQDSPKKNYTKVYCTEKCRHSITHINKRCPTCKKSFFVQRGRSKKVYCSSICAGAILRIREVVMYKNVNFYTTSQGYLADPKKTFYGERMLHRVVYQDYYNMRIDETHTIHHIDGDRKNNKPENLELWTKNHPYGVRFKDLLDQFTLNMPIRHISQPYASNAQVTQVENTYGKQDAVK